MTDKKVRAEAKDAESTGRARGPGQDFLLGCHLSIAGGLERIFETAEELGMTAAQVFSHNARSWRMPPLPPGAAGRFKARWRRSFVRYIVIHTIYLINLASPRPELRRRSIAAVIAELRRAAELDIRDVNTHVGAHVGQGLAAGLRLAGDSLREILRATEGLPVRLLLENTAGGGSVIGGRFSELAELIARAGAPGPDRLGVCFDTCHAFAAGYNITNAPGVERVLHELDHQVGLERLKLIHLNDSKYGLGSRKDRHEHIGYGQIGLEGFRALLNHPAVRDLPFILETPKMVYETTKLNSDADELNLNTVRRLRENS